MTEALHPYGWMFLSSFIAGTFLPFLPASSEVVFIQFVARRQGDPALLLVVATFGNLLGAVVNYVAGRYVSGLAGRRWFPATEAQMERASAQFNHYGVWILLLTWVPLIGDIITVIAGLLRMNVRLFLVLTALGKFFRYFAIAVGIDWFQGWPE